MNKDYSKSIQLRCVVCGSDSDFECNDDKTYIKCNKCNREYLGGYNELVELNKGLIHEEIEHSKKEIARDVHDEITTMFKKTLGRFQSNDSHKIIRQ